jgi:Spy/CpxP family protein refolding chaperone
MVFGLRARLPWAALAAGLAAALWAAAAAPAAASGRLEKVARWWNSPEMVRLLELTPAEKNRLDALFSQLSRVTIDLRAQRDQARLELRQAFAQEPLQEKRAQRAFRRLEELKALRSRQRHQFLLEVRKLLGPERYQRLKALYREHRERRGDR